MNIGIKDRLDRDLSGGDLIGISTSTGLDLGVLKPVQGKVHYYSLVHEVAELNPWCASTRITDGKRPYVSYINTYKDRIVILDPSTLDEDKKAQYDIISKYIKGI